MRRLLTVLLLACSVVWVLPGAAQAHDVLVGSTPSDGARLAAGPSEVTLVFNTAVRRGYAHVNVTGPGGTSWADGNAVVHGERVSVKVLPLGAAGVYVVGYRILSSDGHPVSGKITFTLTSPGLASSAASAPAHPDASASPVIQAMPGSDLSDQAAEAAANGGAGMAVVWLGAALLILAAGTVVALRRSSRT